MTSISQVPQWFKTAKSRAAKPTSRAFNELMSMTTDLAGRDYVTDQLKAIEKVWRMRRWQTSWLQLY